MILSDDKISHLTHIALKGLLEKGAVKILTEESLVRREMKRIINRELKIAEGIDEAVKKKLQSYSRKIYEGSSEWEVLYQKFFDEEMARRGRG